MPNFTTCEPTEENFRSMVDFLFSAKRDDTDGLLHGAVGLSGESGEVLDHIKKTWVYGRSLDVEKVTEEMGDTIHYFFMLMIKLQEHTGRRITLAEFFRHNMVKLSKRYPDGFSKEAALARADKV